MENQVINYHHLYILGGHALSTSYALALQDALKNGQIAYDKIFCVTDDPQAKAIEALGKDHIIAKSPASFILDYAKDVKLQHTNDTLVPDHTAKHVMLEVFMEFVRHNHPELKCTLEAFESEFKTPFLYKGENGALWAMSYATWACPADCAEPGICPHTKNPRDWDFFESLKELFTKLPDETYGKYQFGCQPLCREISQIPLTEIVAALEDFEKFIADTGAMTAPLQRRRRCIVATHSRCHGILGQFGIIS